MKIACPSCDWEPTASARWSCTCGHAWNTFDTGGQCPACGAVWRDTQCLACRKWAKHHNWYRDLPPVDLESIVTQQDASMGFQRVKGITAHARHSRALWRTSARV